MPLKDLAMGVMMGARDEETISSLAGRLPRLNRQLDAAERHRIEEQAGGVELTAIVGNPAGGDRPRPHRRHGAPDRSPGGRG